jgi:hypothetical protein
MERGGEYPLSLVFTEESLGGGLGAVDCLYCVKVSLLVSSFRARAAPVSKWKLSEADLFALDELLEELVVCVEKNESPPEL